MTVRKKSAVDFRQPSQLSQLLARERLEISGIPDAAKSGVPDPDLDELFDRLREVKKKKAKTPTIKKSLIRKLVKR